GAALQLKQYRGAQRADAIYMADAAKSKRREQLKRWAGSNTDREPAVPRRRRRGDARDRGAEPEAGSPRRVRFERAAEFLAACACGDIEEAKEMLREAREKDTDEYQCGDLVNSANADGITALHQACIDGSMEVVVFLLSQGANVNQADSEGWTPLHVAASCGNVEIADFLLQNGSNVCMVNCDGDVPVDIAEDEDTEALLREHMLRQGVDVAAVKREEEEQIMKDARTWSVEGLPSDLRHPKTGATPLHVAAAKGYIEVLKLLCHCGMELSVTDTDGWTPLHAAAHWGQGDACRILAEQLCNMEAKSNAGQTPLDVADESVKALLEDLSQKQANLCELSTQHPFNSHCVKFYFCLLKAAPFPKNAVLSFSVLWTSVCRMSSRDKMFVQDQSKERGVPGSLEIKEERESSPVLLIVSCQCEKDAEKEERERERESRTARVQPTPQQREEGAGSTDRRIFQAPMRDEESESQRKARSRLMRQSRRSTQGVTLTDLKEAERTVSKNPENQRSIQPVSPVITVTPAERDMGPTKDGGPDGEKAMRAGAKERRRGRKERRSTGLTHLGSEEVEDGDRMEDILSDSSSTHRKVLEENELIREKLQETELLLNENKVELERLRQSQENSSERPALLELERFVLADLRADNQRLKDENAALIRVISKLSR
ncbi:hypothetical protein Z043_104712, partial [Scleropages formosus]